MSPHIRTEPITTTERWRAEHACHLPPGKTFHRQQYSHPDGTWVALVCECGQKHLMIDADAEPRVQ